MLRVYVCVKETERQRKHLLPLHSVYTLICSMYIAPASIKSIQFQLKTNVTRLYWCRKYTLPVSNLKMQSNRIQEQGRCANEQGNLELAECKREFGLTLCHVEKHAAHNRLSGETACNHGYWFATMQQRSMGIAPSPSRRSVVFKDCAMHRFDADWLLKSMLLFRINKWIPQPAMKRVFELTLAASTGPVQHQWCLTCLPLQSKAESTSCRLHVLPYLALRWVCRRTTRDRSPGVGGGWAERFPTKKRCPGRLSKTKCR